MTDNHTWLQNKSWNVKDEYYTPKILVDAILPHIPSPHPLVRTTPTRAYRETVWCPFDTENSEFVIRLKENGYNVIHSHIWEGKDFFNYVPEQPFDMIISNPPFSLKLKVFERLFKLGKPFLMLMGLPILNYQVVGAYFHRKQNQGKRLQLLIVDKKVSFNGDTSSFNNSYFGWNILQEDIIFAHLEHNNSGENYVGSRMGDSESLPEIEKKKVEWL